MKVRSLSGRVALLLVCATVCVLGAAALVMDHMVDAEMGRRFDAGLLTQARILASMSDMEPEGLTMEDVSGPHLRMLSGRSQVVWAVRCTDGSRETSFPAPTAYPPAWRQATDAPVYADVKADGHVFRAVWFRFRAGDEGDGSPATASASASGSCALLFMRSRAELDDVLDTIDGILLMTPMLALLIVFLLSPWLVRRGLKPLTELGESMRAIGPQASGNRLPPTGTRELEPLVTRFNEVLARMDEGMAREREFAGALAHETRTRLAELRTLIDVELRYPSDRPVNELLKEIGHIGGELQNTVSGLLLLTRLDARIETLRMARLDVADVLARHVEHLAPVWQGRGLRMECAPKDAHASLVADASLLDIIIGNVLGNACAYAPEGSTVQIRLRRAGLEVGNPAPTLDHDEVACFGQRFWSKHHGAEGHAGLGLALA
ncbi:MAG TPA: HAMP domain-containing sensor histidine kinase, partial [Oleiagrimonas sp.]|nr:HAMP domain-containing sensor histidine kinase [Oleiagrimonas sp.]